MYTAGMYNITHNNASKFVTMKLTDWNAWKMQL